MSDLRPQIGSLWRKWDLHVHTPESILENRYPRPGGQPDWDAYTGALEQTDLAVVGATDYFTIDGYKKLRELKTQGRLANIATILPNIEFRLEQVLSSRRDTKPRRLNFHVVFSDDLDPRIIEEHFLHDLEFTYEGNPQGNDFRRKLKPSNLRDLGERLLQDHPAFAGNDPLWLGASKAVVDHKQISSLLSGDPRFRDKYVLVLPEELSNLIDWNGQDHQVRKVVLQKSDLVFSSNPSTVSWCLGEDPYLNGPKGFVEEFKSLKPCVHGSDAHCLEEIGKPCARRGTQGHKCGTATDCEMRFCWVKADPTFEGLRQLLVEPAARVQISSGNPAPTRSPHSIKSVAFNECEVNPELTLAATAIDLNPQLIAVVGGRGMGKTAFVDLLANSFDNRLESGDDNSFVLRIHEDEPELTTQIAFENGDAFTKAIDDDHFYEDSDVIYIPQGALNEQVRDSETLARRIEWLVFESGAVANSVKRHELELSAERIEGLSVELQQHNRRVVDAEAKADPAKRKTMSGDIKKGESELKDLDKRIAGSRKRLTGERAKEAERKQEDLAKLRDRKEKLTELRLVIGKAQKIVVRTTDEFGLALDDINDRLKDIGVKVALPAFRYGGEAKLEELRGKVNEDLAAVAQAIETQSKDLAKLAGEQETLARVLDLKKRRELDVQKQRKNLAAAERAEIALADTRKARRDAFGELIKEIQRRQVAYGEVIALFAQERDRILADLEFSADVKCDWEDMTLRAKELLDLRSVVLQRDKDSPGALGRYMALAEGLFGDGTTDVNDFLNEAERLLDELREKQKEARATGTRDVHELVFRDYFTFTPDLRYKKKVLKNLSLGQKATVLIKSHLAEGRKTIIIDSHDDHLDNEFIMEELVEGLRQAKDLRQVIVVSNNGNVVVNSDAEQIIIATMEGAMISYQAGSLENPDIRERLIKILEGGEDAFRRRGDKYRLSR